MEPWVRLAVEQIIMDTGGMQVRFWHNDRPWLQQPGPYTDCFTRVQNARKVFSDWQKSQPKKNPDEPSTAGGANPANRKRPS